MGPHGEALFDYAIYDAYQAGFRRFVFVIQDEHEAEFRRHTDRVWAGEVAIDFTHQAYPPAPRQTPWGTGHAVLAARDTVRGPFGMINADDWYGATGYALLADHLVRSAILSHAAVTYPLRVTPMSETGGVSRAICEIDQRHRLRGMTEVKDIRRSGYGYVGNSLSGDVVVLDGTEPASMNQWGFRPAIFGELASQFDVFVAGPPGPADEFLIGAAIDDGIRRGTLDVQALPSDEAGLGITFRDDVEGVAGHVRSLTAAGRYPSPLRLGP